MGCYSILMLAIFLTVWLISGIIVNDFMIAFAIAIGVVFALWVYFIPLWIARLRKHPHSTAIFFINLLLGCTGIFWFVALIWAFIGQENNNSSDKTESGLGSIWCDKTEPDEE